MRILKFGGTSVGSPEAIRQVIAIVGGKIDPIVVVSAFSKVTDSLIALAEAACSGDPSRQAKWDAVKARHVDMIANLLPGPAGEATSKAIEPILSELETIISGITCLRELSPRTMDLVMSAGERLSSTVVAAALTQAGFPSEPRDARDFIVASPEHGDARPVKDATERKTRAALATREKIPVVTGFIASTESGTTVTLGRGGSDYTAAILGAALGADEVEIWTDVDGIMTADPRKVKDAFSMESLQYDEAMELSWFGAKVIYPPTVQPALERGIPIRILNTFNPGFPGTVIKNDVPPSEYPVRGITTVRDAALVTLQGPGMIGVAGIAMRLFGCLARKKISVTLISQASSEHSICFALPDKNRLAAIEAMREEFKAEMREGLIEDPVSESGKTILAVVGAGMRHYCGIAGRLFNALGRHGVNIAAIAQGSSELNISAVIDSSDETLALNTVHDAFFKPGLKTVDVFLSGRGLVGGELLDQIRDAAATLFEKRMIRVRVLGIANSRKVLFDGNGIDLEDWKERFDRDAKSPDTGTALESLLDGARRFRSANAVFVDCTASDEPPKLYLKALKGNVAVVTSNKRGNAGTMKTWNDFMETSRETGTPYLYETTVGAGLPVISTLRDLVSSGDTVTRIEAVLSGTLGFVITNYDGSAPFVSFLKEAMRLGYAEPDPRDDLGAMDAARKALILAREAGYCLEPSDITIESLIPDECARAKSVDEFLVLLEKADSFYRERYESAKAKGKKLAYAVTVSPEGAKLGLREVGPGDALSGLKGPENLVAFTTARYVNLPVVVRGPGAGAAVTAGGLFADIIRLATRPS